MTIQFNRANVSGWTMCAFTGLLIFAGLIVSSPLRLEIVNSDTYYLVCFYRDLFVDQFRVWCWNLGPAPFFFPDFPLLSLAMAITDDVGQAFTIYGVLSMVIVALGFYYIFKFCLGRYLQWRDSLVLLGAALFVVSLVQTHAYDHFSFYFFLPSNHNGVVIGSVVLAAISLRMLQRGITVLNGSVFFLVATLVVFSDLFILPHGLIPLMVAFGLFAVLGLQPLRRGFSFLIISLLAIYLGKKIARYFRWEEVFHIPKVGDEYSSAALEAVVRDMKFLFSHTPLLFVSLLLFFILCVWTMYRHRAQLWGWKKSSEGADSTTRAYLFFILFSLLVVCATIAVPIVKGRWENLQNIRYLLPIYVLPPFTIALILATQKSAGWRGFAWGLTGAVMLFGLYEIGARAMHFDWIDLKIPYTAGLQAFDEYAKEHGLKYGYGNYWYAKPITVKSHAGLRVYEVSPEIGENFWFNNPNWYCGLKRSEPEQYPTYKFIVANGLPNHRIVERFGEPSAIKRFKDPLEDLEVFIYDRPEDYVFRNYFRMSAWDRSFRDGAAALPYEMSPFMLQIYNPYGAPRFDDNVYAFRSEAGMTVTYSEPVRGNMIEILADGDDEYDIHIMSDNTEIGKVHCFRQPPGRLQVRFLPLPASAIDQPFNRLNIEPKVDNDVCIIGHLFVYDDPLLGTAK